jgi:predicted transglutaminase-like cysteine proteinase
LPPVKNKSRAAICTPPGGLKQGDTMSVFAYRQRAQRQLVALGLLILAGTNVATAADSAGRKRLASIEQTSSLAVSSFSSSASAPVHFFTINQVLARHDRFEETDQPVRIAVTTPMATMTDELRTSVLSEEPFGLLTFRAPEGQLWVKWRALESALRADEEAISLCRADPDQCTSPAALQLLGLIDKAGDTSGRGRIAKINRSINYAIRYVSDIRQHGVVDLWSPPLATIASGKGDCEDYAIAKYAALRQMGFGPDDLRLLLVRDRSVGLDHAVLGVHFEGRWLVLDNRHSILVESDELWQFTPLFAINHQGVKLFAASLATAASKIKMVPAASGDF